jgi:hypothetical protein
MDTKIHGYKESNSDDNYDDTVVFMDEKAQEYQDLIESQLSMTSAAKVDVEGEEEEYEISIDDI